jgi:hypothetical protein
VSMVNIPLPFLCSCFFSVERERKRDRHSHKKETITCYLIFKKYPQ